MPRALAHFHYRGNLSALAKDLVHGEARGVPAHVNDAIRGEWADHPGSVTFDTGEQINTATGEVLTATPERPGREHTGLTLPISFYESRPELKEIREYAHRWGAPADPVLYAILASISATVPPGQRVQTGIMSPKGSSLNLFVAAIGPSGSCKSSNLSDDEVQQDAEADRREVDPPIQVETAVWSKAGQLDWWVKEQLQWFGRVRGPDGRQRRIKAADLRPASDSQP
jgi:hypothetical protein